MKKDALFIFGMIMGGVAAAPACAYNGTINITGSVTAGTCTAQVNGAGSGDGSVQLPTVSVNALSAQGATAGSTPFSLMLSGCPTTAAPPLTGMVRAYFENINVNQSTGYLSNKASSKASNVEIQILSANMTTIDLRSNAGNDALVNTIPSGSATLKYFAQYIATGSAGPGQVSSDLVYTLEYQ